MAAYTKKPLRLSNHLSLTESGSSTCEIKEICSELLMELEIFYFL